ncbi:MAG: acylphosphatase [Thermoplasmata archaeon]|nr:MAG: acylphosphatase [Thermoplasmata archaeon]HEC89179.1 acylphosphatase [Thermoplasmatales archaeon]
MIVAKHVLISGRVQGVWFRATTKEKAEEYNIKGWVRNTSDGKVEAVFIGEEEDVEKMIQWCHHGPPLARVEKVEVSSYPSTEDFKDFTIRY